MAERVTHFENRYITSMDVLEEVGEHVIPLKFRDWRTYLGLILILVTMIILSIYSVQEVKPLNVAIGWVLICFIYLFLYPPIYAKRVVRRSRINFTNAVDETVAWFEDDGVIVGEGDLRSVFRYHQFKTIVETRNLFCLMVKPETGVYLRKDSFTLGTEEKFRLFIQKRCNKKLIVRK